MRDSMLLIACLLHVPPSDRPKTPMVFVRDFGSSMSMQVNLPFEFKKASYHDLEDMA